MRNIFGKKIIKGRVFLNYYSVFVLSSKQLTIKCTTYLCANLRKTVYIQFKSTQGCFFCCPTHQEVPPNVKLSICLIYRHFEKPVAQRDSFLRLTYNKLLTRPCLALLTPKLSNLILFLVLNINNFKIVRYMTSNKFNKSRTQSL